MNIGKVTGALFIDLKKAYDTEKNYLQKLGSYGITNTIGPYLGFLHIIGHKLFVSIQLSQM